MEKKGSSLCSRACSDDELCLEGVQSLSTSHLLLTRSCVIFFHSGKFDDYPLLACCSIRTTITKINSTVSVKVSSFLLLQVVCTSFSNSMDT